MNSKIIANITEIIRTFMAKQHLVESFSVSAKDRASTYHELTNNVPEQIKESFNKVKEHSKLNEAKSKPTQEDLKAIKESLTAQKISEDKINSVLKSLSEGGITNAPRLWEFPVSRINDASHPNLNGRVYNKALWENVITKQEDTWKGLAGLIDHPDDDSYGSFGDQGIVWLGARIDEDSNLVYGIGTFVGKGHLAEEIIDVGGRVGFSSSGYGDFLDDGITVDPDTYEIERLADLVLCPSQSVYGTEANAIVGDIGSENEVTDSLYESKRKTNNIEENKMKKEDNKKSSSSVMTKMVEAYFKQSLADAKAIKERNKRIVALNALIEEIEQDQTQSEEKDAVAKDAQACLDADMEKADAAVDSLDKVEDETGASNMEEAIAKIKEMKARIEAYEAKDKESKAVADTLKTTMKQLESAKSEAAGLRSNLKAISESNEAQINHLKKAKAFSKDAAGKKLDEMESEIEALNRIKSEVRSRNRELRAENDALVARYNKLLTAYTAMREDFRRAKAKNAKLSEAYEKYTQLKRKVDEASREDELVRDYYAKKTTATTSRPRYGRALSENEEVKLYYADLREQYGDAVRPFARDILTSKTLKDAQSIFMKNIDNITGINLDESDTAYAKSTSDALNEILGDNE